jgi:hypothetical protein
MKRERRSGSVYVVSTSRNWSISYPGVQTTHRTRSGAVAMIRRVAEGVAGDAGRAVTRRDHEEYYIHRLVLMPGAAPRRGRAA